MTKCLVLGGAGFLGSTLAMELERHGFEVSVFDLFKKKPVLPLPKTIKKVKGNILSEKQLSNAIVAKDFVFHFAYASVPATSLSDPSREITQNIIPSVKIMEQCISKNVQKIVFPSSGTVYGKGLGRPFNESDKTNPTVPYAISKLAIENFLSFFESKGLDFAVLRPGSAFGPGQNPFSGAGAVTTFLYNALHEQPIRIFGKGETMRDYTFSQDIVYCALKSIGLNGSLLANVSSGNSITTKQLAEKCIELSGKNTKIEFLEPRKSDLDNIALDNSFAKSVFGFSPTALEDGIAKTLKWLNENY